MFWLHKSSIQSGFDGKPIRIQGFKADISLRENIVAQKASTMFSSDSPHFSDHFHLLLSIVVMYN
jgi:hypothetical protein